VRDQDVRRTSAPGDSASNDSFEIFLEQVRPHLHAVRAAARRILGDDDAAADAVQEALITLWQTDVLPEHLRRWLLRTVVHRSLHARRSRLRRSYWEDQGGGAVLACTLCDPERELEIRELIDCLDRALAALSPEQREILVLRDFEGFEYREISDLLGLPVGTVRSRLNRARARVRASAEADE
jgi:RNA polymerase sigma-70 factor (ECF subfamily)